jgi:hypothetical protein
MSKVIRTFILSVVKSETGQRNKFFSKRVDSDLFYILLIKMIKTNRPLIPSYYIFHMYACFGINHQHNKGSNNKRHTQINNELFNY